MAKIPFPITTYQLPNGQPLANGYLRIRLSQEGSTSDSQLSVRNIQVPLNSSGQMVTNAFWSNSVINPSGTYYIITAYTANGQLVLGPTKVTL